MELIPDTKYRKRFNAAHTCVWGVCLGGGALPDVARWGEPIFPGRKQASATREK